MHENKSTLLIPEKVILIGLISRTQDEVTAREYLDELEFLVDTAGGNTIKRFLQRLDMPDSRTFVGSGKLIEIKNYIKEFEVNIAVFDDQLSPSQIRNIENVLECKILDRNNLILDIFARRARTAHARTQVELAQYQYLLPRLTNMWTHLSKQKGGIGLKGPGEKEIETDRRVIRDKIALLKKELIIIDKQKFTQRQHREGLIRVSLVGYTNVGKSTIMNLLSKSNVFAENKLFATLDTTVRKVIIGNLPFLLSDTVGFIRKLPHGLVESFKSTLDEVRESDILLHVVDISHPRFEEQMQIVEQTLAEIGASGKLIITIFNKIDAYSIKDITKYEDETIKPSEEFLDNSWMSQKHQPAVFISATQKTQINIFRKLLYEEVKKLHITRYPYNQFLFLES